LLVAGVTGTTGKTAASLFLRSIFEASGLRFGLVGQLGWSEGAGMRPAGSALPRTEGLAAMLAEMVERGCAGGVIEVSGEALDQRRFEGTAFDLAIVTCVSGAPGESAEAVIARRRAKARLLRALAPGGAAIINADDPHAEILGAVNLDARRVTFSLTRAADVTGRVERLGADGSRIVLRGFDREVTVALGLVGPASVTHALAAAAAAWAQGIDTDAVVAGLEAVRTIPGHLEAVDENQDFDVRVDQARDPAALHEALEAVRAIVPGQVHCVVGAEGHRDRSERLALAHVAELGADRLTLTTNNSRTEDPNQILDDLLAGLRRPAWARVEPDRHRAIEMALAAAQPGDGVLIAGKGRHAFQILADRAIPFDDHEVARRWLRGRQERARRTSA
jgi:UDP-N-acetylmuramoyl-L-alanyl-D-glutamate--2,6-diaminopimelate ligase